MSRYFNRNLDSASVRSDLLSHDASRQLNAVKQVIAYMVTGKDMSSHYNDIANLLSSPDLQMKKLVYLYLMQNSKSQPEKAVLQAGTFVHDTNHASPLIRGIALRTMSSMLVPAMVDFLHPPVLARLHDPDPYVRRNAAFACLKLFTIAPEVCKQTKLLDAISELLTSSVPSIVASAVCVISEIVTLPGCPTHLQTSVASHALSYVAMLESCGEWAQLYLLEGVSQLFRQKRPTITLEEAETVVTRVMPQLRSMNVAVSMASIKVVLAMLMQFTNPLNALAEDLVRTLENKYIPTIVEPLMSQITTTKHEVRYVALRNLILLLNAGPVYVSAFTPHLSHLFVKYDDPIYLKLEKIESLLLLAAPSNASRILAELSEYAAEGDVEVVRRAVRGIGSLALRMEDIADDSFGALVGLLANASGYGADAISEAAIVFHTVMRQYPTRFISKIESFAVPPQESGAPPLEINVLEALHKSLDVIADGDGRAAVVWAIGEYAKKEGSTILSFFLEEFTSEPPCVQLAVLTALTKIYLRGRDQRSGENVAAYNSVMSFCKASEIPDVRDRAFFYWRLISADEAGAARVLLGHKGGSLVAESIERQLLGELLSQAGRLSSVIHKSTKGLIGEGTRAIYLDEAADETPLEILDSPKVQREGFQGESTVLDFIQGRETAASTSAQSLTSPVSKVLLGQHASAEHKLLSTVNWEQVMEAHGAGKGLSIHMGWSHGQKGPQLHTRLALDASATESTTVKVTTMQLNVNVFGIGITQGFPETVLRAGAAPTIVSVGVGANNQRKGVTDLQVALKVEPIGVLYFVAPPIPMHLVLQPATGCDPAVYAAEFEVAEVGWQLPPDFPPLYTSSSRLNGNSLRLLSLNLVHTKENGPVIGIHVYASTIAGQRIYAAVSVENNRISTVTVKSNDSYVCTPFGEYLLASLAV